MGFIDTSFKKLQKFSAFLVKLASKKCPKCGSMNLTVVKQNFLSRGLNQFSKLGLFLLFPISIFFGRSAKKPLNVCKDCGFSWEDR